MKSREATVDMKSKMGGIPFAVVVSLDTKLYFTYVFEEFVLWSQTDPTSRVPTSKTKGTGPMPLAEAGNVAVTNLCHTS